MGLSLNTVTSSSPKRSKSYGYAIRDHVAVQAETFDFSQITLCPLVFLKFD